MKYIYPLGLGIGEYGLKDGYKHINGCATLYLDKRVNNVYVPICLTAKHPMVAICMDIILWIWHVEDEIDWLGSMNRIFVTYPYPYVIIIIP